jgi:hypothetical protein
MLEAEDKPLQLDALAGIFYREGDAICTIRHYKSVRRLWSTVQDLECTMVEPLNHITVLGDPALDSAWLMTLNATGGVWREDLDFDEQKWKSALVFGESEAMAWTVLESSSFWRLAEDPEPGERHGWCAVPGDMLIELLAGMPGLQEFVGHVLNPAVEVELLTLLPAVLTLLVRQFLWPSPASLKTSSRLHKLKSGEFGPRPIPPDPD